MSLVWYCTAKLQRLQKLRVMNKPLEQMSTVIKNAGIFSSVKYRAMDRIVSRQNLSWELLAEITRLELLGEGKLGWFDAGRGGSSHFWALCSPSAPQELGGHFTNSLFQAPWTRSSSSSSILLPGSTPHRPPAPSPCSLRRSSLSILLSRRFYRSFLPRFRLRRSQLLNPSGWNQRVVILPVKRGLGL